MTIDKEQLALLRAQARRCVRELDRLCDQLAQLADCIVELEPGAEHGLRGRAPDWPALPHRDSF